MKVLVVGSGGREHTLVWKIKQSTLVTEIFCAPGNPGIAQLATCVDIASNNISALLEFAQTKGIDLTVVGPEDPLVMGIVDAFEEKGLAIFGPSKHAAQLEGSKAFMKQFLKKYYIPTAAYETFESKETAWTYVCQQGAPIVIKTDGLAAGKGAFVCMSLEEAQAALETIFDQKAFGESGNKVVVEEFMEGEEASVLVICDGHQGLLMDAAQDHKRAFDQDQGPNTGGMGAYCPAPVVSEELYVQIRDEIVIPTLDGMRREGAPYKGILYVGLMLTKEGPKVVEYNVRFGDPETQVVLPRLTSDLVELMQASIAGDLSDQSLLWDSRAAVCVVVASGGYPGTYRKGVPIQVNEDLVAKSNVILFHAGTSKQEGRLVTSGGRVFGLTALGEPLTEAVKQAYAAVSGVSFEGAFYRKDIAHRAL